MERTLVLIKPDAVQRSLVGEITLRLERKGLKLVACKMMTIGEDLLKQHYSHHVTKPFYPELAGFMSSSPIVAQVWEGIDAVEVARNLCGATNSRKALPGTIRGDFAISMQCNVLHSSDSLESADAEIERFFRTNEIYEYDRNECNKVYSKEEQNMKLMKV